MKPSINAANVATSTVIVSGTLMIRDIPKRAGGSFKVGKLSTHIGQFEVKDPELDQYDAGTYSGNFCIDKIYPAHYIAGGKIVIEMRAVLSCFVLAGFDTETGEVETLDVDPAETDVDEGKAATADPAPADEAPATDNMQVMSVEEEQAFRLEQMDKDTFGDLYPLGVEVKLDPTVGRTKLRAQCDRLKLMGYKFQAARQTWVHAA
ncbi:MAG: DUF3275 family protein [Thiothrix sp.]|uniref:DUF3275 family protein n=1 Tax=Thiothrix sp. TaxID=1032 RepID=UPI00260E4FAF|nr:DUF3275 family protein [Thiothrix sp.]MDD5394310.1 DUF3275 family protein [Thiothrix sp.]